jgi:hypothetical protein
MRLASPDEQTRLFGRRGTLLRRISLIVAASMAAASILASPASAATKNHGMLTGAQFFCGTVEVDGPAVTGSWSLSLDRRSRTADSPQDQRKPHGGLHINVFYDGDPHLSIEANDLVVRSLEGGVYTFSAFGGVATATLDTNTGAFTWHVELGGGCTPDRPYDSLTYIGSTTQG